MRIDHRRPLVAYILVALACAFVVAQGMRDLPSLGPAPSVSAFSDTTMTPSETSEQIVDPPVIGALPEPEVVEDGEPAPSFSDSIEDFLGAPLFPDTTDTADAGGVATAAEQPVTPGTQVQADPPDANLTDTGGSGGPDNGGGNGGGFGGLPDPDPDSGGGVFGPPLDGGPGDGDGDGHGDGDGPGHGDGPVPHDFDKVPPGGHPFGHVGPPPGNGNGNGNGNGHQGGGPKDHSHEGGQGPKDQGSHDSQGHGPQGHGPQGHDGSKDKGAQGGKAKGHDKKHGKDKRKGPRKINPIHGKRGPR